MAQPESPSTTEPRRHIRFADVDASDAATVANGIEDLYNEALDVIVVRNAFPQPAVANAGAMLDRDDNDPGWARPNEKVAVEDIRLLGTPATPTYVAPRGPSLDAYLATGERQRAIAEAIFDSSFDPTPAITEVLSRFSGGRPVDIPRAQDGRPYIPFTVRRLVDGTQIGAHHDYHYPLPVLSELVPHLDTLTLISYVITLQRPQSGGELVVYPVTQETPDAPKMPNGWAWDIDAIDQRFESARFVTGVGDLFLFASGRCLHRVDRIVGPRARVTMGGFLALTKARDRVLYWS